MASLVPRVEQILPRLRARARSWVQLQEEADDIVCRALELAIKRVDDRPSDLESWLLNLLDIAWKESQGEDEVSAPGPGAARKSSSATTTLH